MSALVGSRVIATEKRKAHVPLSITSHHITSHRIMPCHFILSIASTVRAQGRHGGAGRAALPPVDVVPDDRQAHVRRVHPDLRAARQHRMEGGRKGGGTACVASHCHVPIRSDTWPSEPTRVRARSAAEHLVGAPGLRGGAEQREAPVRRGRYHLAAGWSSQTRPPPPPVLIGHVSSLLPY